MQTKQEKRILLVRYTQLYKQLDNLLCELYYTYNVISNKRIKSIIDNQELIIKGYREQIYFEIKKIIEELKEDKEILQSWFKYQ